MKKKIFSIFIISCAVWLGQPVLAATTNLVSWNELDLEIEDNVPCSFDTVLKFKGKYYAFSSIQGSGEGVGVGFFALTSTDGVHWSKISENSFGDKNDISIDSATIWKNPEGKTHLYIAARNKTTGVNVYRTKDGKNWKRVIANGLDSANNDRINVMVPFKGKLYMITENDIDEGGNGSEFFISDTGNKNDWTAQHMNEDMSAPGALVGAKLKHKDIDGNKENYFYYISGNTAMWRTTDGETWQKMPFNIWKNGYGVELINFNGYVYMATFDEFDENFNTELSTRLFRTTNPALGNWEELDLGITGEELITTFGRKPLSKANYLWFGTYPSGYMFRVKKDTNQVERVSEPRLGFEYGPKFPVGIIFTSQGLSVYDGTRAVWQKN